MLRLEICWARGAELYCRFAGALYRDDQCGLLPTLERQKQMYLQGNDGTTRKEHGRGVREKSNQVGPKSLCCSSGTGSRP